MDQHVTYEVTGGVALICLKKPPLNILDQPLRAALAAAIARAASDADVGAVCLAATGKSWSLGGDIGAFDFPPQAPVLADLCQRIASLDRPVIAALHGLVLGGGLELALAAAVRVAGRDAELGLPEVKLGLCPGAGGTQRLPRLIGAPAALEMMLTGAPVSAERALVLQLVDRVVPGDPVRAALDLARAHVAGRRPLPPAGARLLTGAADPDAYLAAVTAARGQGRPRHDLAAPRIIDLVEAALLLPPDAGYQAERDAFQDLARTAQSRALRHLFRADRRARAPFAGVGAAALDRVAVAGQGPVAAGLAGALAAAGVAVTLVSPDSASLSRGLARLARGQQAAVDRGALSETAQADAWARVTPALDWPGASDLILDTLPDDPSLRPAGPMPGAPCLQILPARPRSDQGGALWLVEPVEQVTHAELMAPPGAPAVPLALALAARLGWRLLSRLPGAGFLQPLCVTALLDAADRLLTLGATPHAVDQAARAVGWALGPFELRDLYGADHALCRMAVRRDDVAPDPIGAALARALEGEGRTGRKAGAGYHLYPDRGGSAVADPAMEVRLGALRGTGRGTPAAMGRMLAAALANAGAWAIEAGELADPSDLDLMAVERGFPRWRGGPMHWADESGLLLLRDDLRNWSEKTGDNFWAPAPIWGELIKNGRRFGDLNRS